MIIDAHQHFWKYDPALYGWMDDGIASLRRDYLPLHLGLYLKNLGIDRTILVQAAESLADNPFMLHMAQESGFVGGVVAWLDLAAPDAVAQIKALSATPLIKGIRPVLQGIAQTDWVLGPNVMRALEATAEQGLRFDALITPRHFDVMDTLATRLPDLNIVIDHAAKPVFSGRNAAPETQWLDGMRALAAHPRMHCKISGLSTEFGNGWDTCQFQPYVDHLLAVFGPARLMWGSDWPVLELAGSYPQWFRAFHDLVSGLNSPDKALIMGGTAAKFYGVTS